MNSKKDEIYPFYHIVELTFVPFIGLAVEYFHESFDQGIGHKKTVIEEFKSNTIEKIKYNLSIEMFDCYQSIEIVEDISLEERIEGLLSENWLPMFDENDTKFDRSLKYFEDKIY